MTFNPIAANAAVSPPPASLPEAAATTGVFLQLLIAQMRSQNPLEPQKGTEFISQLAQFNTLEQLMAIRAELIALRQAVKPPLNPK